MKKFSLSNREATLIVVTAISVLLVVACGIYVLNLQRMMADRDHAQGVMLTVKDKELNDLTSYNDTICGEYRKLYTAYIDLLAQSHSVNSSGYARPGSAKGHIDECYQL